MCWKFVCNQWMFITCSNTTWTQIHEVSMKRKGSHLQMSLLKNQKLWVRLYKRYSCNLYLTWPTNWFELSYKYVHNFELIRKTIHEIGHINIHPPYVHYPTIVAFQCLRLVQVFILCDTSFHINHAYALPTLVFCKHHEAKWAFMTQWVWP